MKRILLTGGSGFVGRNLIEYFDKNYPGEFLIDAPRSKDLNVLDGAQVKSWLSGTAAGASIQPGEQYDIVLHFAVYTDAVDKTKDGSKMYEYNKQSFMNFYDLRHMCGRLFYAGSGAEFNKAFPIESVREEDLPKREIPTDPYGKMKYECGQLIEAGENTYNLRIFGLFGQYEYPNRLITYLCRQSIENCPFELNRDVYFDYLYIDDFCRMVHEVLTKDSLDHHTYNMVSGSRVNLLRLVDIVNEIARKRGRNEQKVTVRMAGLNLEYTASCDRFLQEFSGFEFLPIEESVERLYEIYEKENERREDQEDREGCGQGADAGENPGNRFGEDRKRGSEAFEEKEARGRRGADEGKDLKGERPQAACKSREGCKGRGAEETVEETDSQTGGQEEKREDPQDSNGDSSGDPGCHSDQDRPLSVPSVEAQKTGDDSRKGPSEEEIIRMLDALAEGGSSRMAIKVSGEVEAGNARKDYHHGRCDVGSPFATGKLSNFEDGCE